MNPLNYASLEASKRLVEAGIVMETEHYWMHYIKESYLTHFHCEKTEYPFFKTPAPSMAEAWRELPETIKENDTVFWKALSACQVCGDYCSYTSYQNSFEGVLIGSQNYNANPTDALIDLLVWIKGHKGE